MGFDLTGLNPQADTPEPKWDGGDPMTKVAGTEHQYEVDPQIKEEYDDFMKSRMEWQEANEGAYFRNNVWFWRPLWNFVTGCCDNILTERDVEQGYFNDGHKICKTKAKRIASRLRKYLKNGHISAYEAWYSKEISQLKEGDWNKNYPFSIQNVRDFERFCEHSGGFRIC